jgi:hypothetical protein
MVFCIEAFDFADDRVTYYQTMVYELVTIKDRLTAWFVEDTGLSLKLRVTV